MLSDFKSRLGWTVLPQSSSLLFTVSVAQTCQTAICLSVILRRGLNQDVTSHKRYVTLRYVMSHLILAGQSYHNQGLCMVSVAETCQTAICLSVILRRGLNQDVTSHKRYVTLRYVMSHLILAGQSYQNQGLCMVSVAETCQTAICLSVILRRGLNQEVTSHKCYVMLRYFTWHHGWTVLPESRCLHGKCC